MSSSTYMIKAYNKEGINNIELKRMFDKYKLIK